MVACQEKALDPMISRNFLFADATVVVKSATWIRNDTDLMRLCNA